MYVLLVKIIINKNIKIIIINKIFLQIYVIKSFINKFYRNEFCKKIHIYIYIYMSIYNVRWKNTRIWKRERERERKKGQRKSLNLDSLMRFIKILRSFLETL